MSLDRASRLRPANLMGTLTQEEEQELYRAALDDEELFFQPMDDEPLREVLSDRSFRKRLLGILKQPAKPRPRGEYPRAVPSEATPEKGTIRRTRGSVLLPLVAAAASVAVVSGALLLTKRRTDPAAVVVANETLAPSRLSGSTSAPTLTPAGVPGATVGTTRASSGTATAPPERSLRPARQRFSWKHLLGGRAPTCGVPGDEAGPVAVTASKEAPATFELEQLGTVTLGSATAAPAETRPSLLAGISPLLAPRTPPDEGTATPTEDAPLQSADGTRYAAFAESIRQLFRPLPIPEEEIEVAIARAWAQEPLYAAQEPPDPDHRPGTFRTDY